MDAGEELEHRVLPASLLDYKKFMVEPNPCQPVA
jgi:hypothetical protein